MVVDWPPTRERRQLHCWVPHAVELTLPKWCTPWEVVYNLYIYSRLQLCWLQAQVANSEAHNIYVHLLDSLDYSQFIKANVSQWSNSNRKTCLTLTQTFFCLIFEPHSNFCVKQKQTAWSRHLFGTDRLVWCYRQRYLAFCWKRFCLRQTIALRRHFSVWCRVVLNGC